MKLSGYTHYPTEIFVTVGGHIRIEQKDIDFCQGENFVLLSPEQAQKIANELISLSAEALILRIENQVQEDEE